MAKHSVKKPIQKNKNGGPAVVPSVKASKVVKKQKKPTISASKKSSINSTASSENTLNVKALLSEYQKQKCYVQHITEDKMLHKAKDVISHGQNGSFFLFDPSSITKRMQLWYKYLPEVEMFYAVKSNSDPIIINKMVNAGGSFDCASPGEIEKILQSGAQAGNIIYAHPVKNIEHILYAKSRGVNLMTFDCSEEAIKMKKYNPDAEGVLRIEVEETDAMCPISKFGAPKDMYEDIVNTCKKIGMKLRGVSFHVGSGGCSFSIYAEALRNSKTIFEMAKKKKMPELDILDIGGGFSMSAESSENNFDIVAPKISKMLKKEFANCNKKVRVIAEPGRLICQDAMAIVMKIVLAKEFKDKSRRYFIDSGVYQSLACQVFDHEFFKGHPIVTQQELKNRIANERMSFIWGQTCAGLDWLTKDKLLPYMNEGEWIIYRNVGSYNRELACPFNGFVLPPTFYLSERTGK